jgi:hypothetical protein
LPRGAVDADAFAAYLDACENCGLTLTDEHVIVNLEAHSEEGMGWIEGEGMLDGMLELREQLLAGDLRCLYIAWLADVTGDNSYVEDEEGTVEPPVPPGLGERNEALEAFVEFMFLDQDLLDAAAEVSAPRSKPATLDTAGLKQWLNQQPAAKKDDWLAEVLSTDDLACRRRILGEYRRSLDEDKPAESGQRRTLAQLREMADTAEQRREAEAEARREAERQAAAQKRATYLNSLVGQEERWWREAYKHIDTRLPAGYDRAVEILSDLREVAERQGQIADFAERMEELAKLHARKVTLIERLDRAGLRTR